MSFAVEKRCFGPGTRTSRAAMRQEIDAIFKPGMTSSPFLFAPTDKKIICVVYLLAEQPIRLTCHASAI